MKKAFTLIELIFIIIIIGLLAAVSIPKFKNLTKHAKNASIKTVVNSIKDEVENIHAKWLINEDFVWDVDGDGKSDLNENGYPTKLDEGKNTRELFKYIIKVPVKSCNNSSNGCFEEYDDKKYEYNYSATKALRFEYNSTYGTVVCLNGIGISKSECENLLSR